MDGKKLLGLETEQREVNRKAMSIDNLITIGLIQTFLLYLATPYFFAIPKCCNIKLP